MTRNISKQETYMRRAIMVSLVCNIFLVLIKSSALFIVNSLAIAVDLGISFVGLTVSVILFYSIRLANKPADFVHNYGYGKVEHVCEAMEGVVLIGIATAMSFQSIMGLLHPGKITMPIIGFLSSSINCCINFGGAAYIFKQARKSHSPAIQAEGVHYKLEGFISTIIAASFVVSALLVKNGAGHLAMYIDPSAALVVSIIVIIPSFKLAKQSFFKLLDSSIEEDSQLEVLKQLNKHSIEYCEFSDIRTRVSGRKKFIELKIVVPENISLKRGDEIAAKLGGDIKKSIRECEVFIKISPCKRDCTFTDDCPYL